MKKTNSITPLDEYFRDSPRVLRTLYRILKRFADRKNDSVMTRTLITTTPDKELISAVSLMIKNRISSLIVEQDLKPVGIITERDVVKKINFDKDLYAMKVSDLMTSPIVSLDSKDSLFSVLNLMTERNIRKAPIMEKGCLVGIITQTDIVRALCNSLPTFLSSALDRIQVKDIMSTNLATLKLDDSLLKAQELMRKQNIGCILILDNGKLKGIFTERDFVNEVMVKADYLKAFDMEYLMKKDVVTITHDMTVFKAMKYMQKKRFRRLPVLQEKQLVGIITETDLVNSIFFQVKEIFRIFNEQPRLKKASVLSKYSHEPPHEKLDQILEGENRKSLKTVKQFYSKLQEAEDLVKKRDPFGAKSIVFNIERYYQEIDMEYERKVDIRHRIAMLKSEIALLL